jgi:hypothetical protein
VQQLQASLDTHEGSDQLLSKLALAKAAKAQWENSLPHEERVHQDASSELNLALASYETCVAIKTDARFSARGSYYAQSLSAGKKWLDRSRVALDAEK